MSNRVPEPVQWYVRLDAAYVIASSGRIGSQGFDIGTARSYGEIDLGLAGSFAAGRYLGRGFRVEAQVDFDGRDSLGGNRNVKTATRQQRKAGEAKSIEVTSPKEGGGTTTKTVTVPTAIVSNFDVAQSGSAAIESGNIMFNGYWDLPSIAGVRPYVGAGVGLSVRQLLRTTDTREKCTSTAIEYTAPGDTKVTSETQPICTLAGSQARSTTHVYDYGVAIAGSAGLAYEVSRGVHLDVGYRYLWRAFAGEIGWTSPYGTSVTTLADRTDQEVRVGVRFDIQ